MFSLYNKVPLKVKATIFRIYDSKEKKNWHLFSVFECQETDMEDLSNLFCPAKGDSDDNKKVYLTCSEFELTKDFIDDPFNNYKIRDYKGEIDAFDFFNKEFCHIPDKQNSYLPLHDTSYSQLRSVIPNQNGPLWIKTYVDRERATLNYVNAHPKLLKQLEELSLANLGYNLTHFPEQIGNIILVWHHPLVRSIDIHGVTEPNTGIVLKLDFRSAIRPSLRVNVTTFEQRDCIVSDQWFDLNTPGFRQFLPLPVTPRNLMVRVFDNNNDLLYHSADHLIENIGYTISTPSRQIAGIEIEKPDGSKIETPLVQKMSKERFLIGSPTTSEPNYFSDNVTQRKYKGLKTSGSFVFFNGDKDKIAENKAEAHQIVRNLLNRATKRCYVCDDYFDATDFAEYIITLEHEDVPIRILSGYHEMRAEGAMRLANAIENYNKNIGRNITECKMLIGKSSVLHDRFIVVDDDIWAIGASFNELGKRASVIYKIPDEVGHVIIKEIEKWWNDSETSKDVHEFKVPNNKESVIKWVIRRCKALWS